MAPDKAQAAKFLAALDGRAASWTFQTFDDDNARKLPTLARILHGGLDQHWPTLCELNAAGAGVFVTVQETDGRGRRVENIKRVRAVFHEDDGGGFKGAMPVPPQIEVESSPGKRHRYWLVDGMSPDEFAGVMRGLVERHGSDKQARDIARVMRLPGTVHNKGTPHLVRLVSSARAMLGPTPAQEFMQAFPPLVREAAPTPARDDFNAAAVLRALSYVSPDNRAEWLSVGMSLHSATNGSADGYALWDVWSRGETRGVYNADTQARTWDGFASDKPGGVTLGTLFHLAGANGYEPPGLNPLDGFTPIETAHRGSLLRMPRDVALQGILDSLDRDLVYGVLPHCEEAVIYGDPGAGKTFVAIDMAWHIAQGIPWRGRTVKQHPVLYVALEGQTGFDMRMLAARMKLGDTGDWFARLTLPVSLVKDARGTAGMKLIKDAVAELSARCGAPVGLVVIDTLSRAIAGDDENAQNDMSNFFEHRVTALRRECNLTVLLVHHTNKSGGMRGSSVLLGGANTVLRCERDKQSGVRAVIAEKVKDGEEGPLFSYKLDVVQLGTRPDLSPVTSCVVLEVAAVSTVEKYGRDLLVYVPDARPQSLRSIVTRMLESRMYPHENPASLLKRMATIFANGSITIDGITFAFQSRGETGGTVTRITNVN